VIPIEEVLVLGAGAMGREIALQCAMFGYRVSLYDIAPEPLREARAIIEVTARRLAGGYVGDSAAVICKRLYYTDDLQEAAATADLVSENAPEDLDLKRELLGQLGALAAPHTIFATNSSSLTPSMLADATGRPERFLALHFHKTVWMTGVVDVMGHPGTAPEVVSQVTDFARSIGQTPIVLAKERSGYVFNAMLQAYIGAALSLWSEGVASVEDIDRAWMMAERSDHGPFGVMDFIGIDTMRDIIRTRAAANQDPAFAEAAERLSREMVDRGLLGMKSGRGFYTYPDPAYARPGFVGRTAETP
jgi:3-hydroxybutyryl-CoA dehydrogenase